jgi:membrane protein required for colicin V production
MIADIIVAAVLLISAAIAFMRGLIREVLTIVGLIGGLAAAYFFGPKASPAVKEWLGVEENVQPERLFGILPYDLLGDMLAYGGIFIAVVVFLSIATHFLAEGARAVGLGPVDRTFGVIFGLLRGALVLGILYMPFYLLMDKEQKEAFFKDSKTHFYLESTAEWMAQYLPEDTKKTMEDAVDGAEEAGGTRQKLQDLNILPKDEPVQPTTEDGKEGYTEQFRDDMDRLFEQKTDQPQQGPQPAEQGNQ